MIDTKGYAVKSADSEFEVFNFKRRDVGPQDILIEIIYAGILSLRHSSGPERVGEFHLPDGSRTRDRRPRYKRGYQRY